MNALREDETRNVLLIVRAPFSRPEAIAPSVRVPTQALRLRHLAESIDRADQKHQIAETIACLESRLAQLL